MSKEKNYNPKIYKALKVLGNPVRLRVYKAILKEACECNLEEKGKINENCVSSISEKLNLPQPTVSNHVKELMNSGLIETEKRGKNIYLFGSKKFVDDLNKFSNFISKEIYGHEETI